jgi:hypothetical protein
MHEQQSTGQASELMHVFMGSLLKVVMTWRVGVSDPDKQAVQSQTGFMIPSTAATLQATSCQSTKLLGIPKTRQQ